MLRGIGTIAGPVAGAVIYVLLQQYLSQYIGISMIVLGAIAIAVILAAPKGIVGTLQNKFKFELLSARRISA